MNPTKVRVNSGAPEVSAIHAWGKDWEVEHIGGEPVQFIMSNRKLNTTSNLKPEIQFVCGNQGIFQQ
jgi:hypothetical protein